MNLNSNIERLDKIYDALMEVNNMHHENIVSMETFDDLMAVIAALEVERALDEPNPEDRGFQSGSDGEAEEHLE